MRPYEWFRFVKSLDELRVNLDRQRRDIERYRELNDQLSEELGELKCIASEIAELLPEMLEFVMSFGACEKSHTCLECLYPVDCLRAEIEQAIQKWSSEMEGFR